MNLHSLVAPLITAVNPSVSAVIKRSTGWTSNPDGTRTPAYEQVPGLVQLQVQALTYNDIVHLDGLNIQGIRRAIYANGFYASIIRNLQVGGDLIIFPPGLMPEGQVWLLAQGLETWPDWCKFAVTLQVKEADQANGCFNT